MAKQLNNPHPGEILQKEFLKPLGLSENQLAQAIGVPSNRINGIIHGTRGITADTDLRLATLVFLVGLVVGSGQVARIRIERLEQTPQRAVGDLRNIWHLDIVGLNVLQDLTIDVDLVVGALRFLATGGMDAARIHADEDAENEDDRSGEEGDFEALGHNAVLDSKIGLNIDYELPVVIDVAR